MQSLNENVKLTGEVWVRLYDEKGNLKQEHKNSNLVVTVGKSYLAAWLAAPSQAGKFMSYIALGNVATGPTSGDTTLNSECTVGGYSRSLGTLTSASNVWTNTATFAPGNGTDAIVEAGLFTASTAGTMLAHQTFPVYNKQAGDTMVIVWNVSFN
jgi:hypothetical protein